MCEYCRMPESNYPTVPFPIDHIIARQHGGSTTLDNLALSCLHDNTHKGPNIAGIDPISRRISRLFNPRRDKWVRHFEMNRDVRNCCDPLLKIRRGEAMIQLPGTYLPELAGGLLVVRKNDHLLEQVEKSL